MGTTNQKKDTSLTITRVFNAPPELVWKAWTQPEQMKQWWGPKGFTCPVCKMDCRPGGTYLNCMRSPEGKDYWSRGSYREIVPQKKIVCTDSFADEKGNVVSASYYGMSADFPMEMLIVATLEGVQGGTKLTLTHIGIPSGKDQDDCRDGWSQSFDKLADYLAKGKTDAASARYHSITPNLIIRGAREAIDFYKRVFGAEVSCVMERPDGKVMHAEIKIGDSILMIADECPPHEGHESECVRSPADLKGTTTNFYLMVGDPDAVFDRAVKAGAESTMPVTDMFWGDRVGMFRDPFGHFWSVAAHVRDLTPEQVKQGAEEFYSKSRP